MRDRSKLLPEHNPSDFLVIHSGNMGFKQDLLNIVRAAKILETQRDIRILLVGHGNQQREIAQLSEKSGNIKLMPAVPKSDFSALLASADLLLINERSTQLEMSLPSKLTSYLCSARPVLAAVAPGGATHQFLAGIAEIVPAGDPKALAKAIVELRDNPQRRKSLAEAGTSFGLSQLAAESGRRKYRDLIATLNNNS